MSTAAQSKDPRNPKTLLRYHQVFIINGQAVTMKIDSGAQNSIISKLDWQRMGQPALTPPTRERISSAGTTVQLEGEFDADVEFEGKHYTLPLQVSSRDTTRNLTGRRWFPVFNSLDWNALFYDGGKIVKLPNASSEAASDQIEKETITIPYFLRIKVENKVLIMKLDTGATASVIGLSEWKQIGEPKLEQPKRRMTDTAGTVVCLRGEGRLNVTHKGETHCLPIVVKNSNKPCALIGTRWFSYLTFDFNLIFRSPTFQVRVNTPTEKRACDQPERDEKAKKQNVGSKCA